MCECTKHTLDASRRMVETRDLLIADLERENSELQAERDALLATIRYCTGILVAAGHDTAAPLEAMVRRSIAYGAQMESERDAERTARKELEAYVRSATPDTHEATRRRDAALALVRELPRSVSLTPPEWKPVQQDHDSERTARKALEEALRGAWLSERAPDNAHHKIDAALALAAKLP